MDAVVPAGGTETKGVAMPRKKRSPAQETKLPEEAQLAEATSD